MECWVDKHIDWVQQVTKPFLERICLSFQKFKDQWLHPMFPLNSGGILIMSRAYKLHTAVFFNDKFWTTFSAIRESPPCSECEKQKKRSKSVTDCKKCSKCQLKESNTEYSDELDLEQVLDDTMETENIMAMDKESTEKGQSEDSEKDEPNQDDVTENDAETEADNKTTVEKNDMNTDKEIKDSEPDEQDESNKDDVENYDHETDTSNKVAEKTDNETTEKDSAKSTDTQMDSDKHKDVNSEDRKNIMPKAVVSLIDIASTSGFVQARKSDSLKPKTTPPKEEEDETSSGKSEEESDQEPPKKKKKISEIGQMISNVKPDKHGRYNCPKRACHRDYGTKRALHRHMKNNHSGKWRSA